jgi:hypothetical protein
MRYSPRQMICAGPRSNTCPSQCTVWAPPVACTRTGDFARSGPRRLCFADAALKEADLNVLGITHFHEFHVDPVLEIVMLANFRTLGLPADWEVVDENRKVRIAHGNRDTANLAESYFDGELVAHLRLAHRGLKFKKQVGVRGQRAGLDPCTSAYR